MEIQGVQYSIEHVWVEKVEKNSFGLVKQGNEKYPRLIFKYKMTRI